MSALSRSAPAGALTGTQQQLSVSRYSAAKYNGITRPRVSSATEALDGGDKRCTARQESEATKRKEPIAAAGRREVSTRSNKSRT